MEFPVALRRPGRGRRRAAELEELGFPALWIPDDLASVSDSLLSAIIVWGDEEAISQRVQEHVAAGADHVCVQVLEANPATFPREQWRRLAAALR